MRDTTQRTRRTFLGTIAASALASGTAGCLGGDDPSEDDSTGDGGNQNGSDQDDRHDDHDQDQDDRHGEDDNTSSYSVSIEPVGTVEFDTVPERWFSYTGDYADMGVALGHGDGLVAVGLRERFGTHYYNELPDVSIDDSELTELWQGSTDKEIFYELKADVHVIDPNFMINQLGWDEGDVDEIRDNVAPFVGNTIFSRSYPWHDYEHYTLYEAFEKVAELFQETERYEAFVDLHDEFISDVQARLPDESPEIAILAPNGAPPDAFYGYTLDGGTQSKQWEDLGVEDALANSGVGGFHETGGTLDYETILEVDPDAIVIWQEAGVTAENFEEHIVEHMEDHSVARNLTAVENERVIFGGLFYQGPIINLFQLEMAAQGLYPEEFGDEELFDRQAVNDIVTGEF